MNKVALFLPIKPPRTVVLVDSVNAFLDIIRKFEDGDRIFYCPVENIEALKSKIQELTERRDDSFHIANFWSILEPLDADEENKVFLRTARHQLTFLDSIGLKIQDVEIDRVTNAIREALYCHKYLKGGKFAGFVAAAVLNHKNPRKSYVIRNLKEPVKPEDDCEVIFSRSYARAWKIVWYFRDIHNLTKMLQNARKCQPVPDPHNVRHYHDPKL